MDYSELAEIYEKLESTTKRLEKTKILSDFFKKCSKEDLSKVVYLVQGRVFPSFDERKIGMSSKLIVKTISKVIGISSDEVEKEWRKKGDLGLVVSGLGKKQKSFFSAKLSIKKVFDDIQKLSLMEGKGAVGRKVDIVAGLISNSQGMESKFIVKTVLEELRVGVSEGVVRDSLVWAFLYAPKYENGKVELNSDERKEYNSFVDLVQEAYDLTGDFGDVAVRLKDKKDLKEIGVKVGIPIKSMLAIKVADMESGLDAVGKTLLAEYKFDGFRMQIHNDGKEIKLFTRSMEDVTKQFYELIDEVKKTVKGKNYILDSEVVGIDLKTGNNLPFQFISQRIKRKYDIEEIAKKIPVVMKVFDVLYLDGKSLMNKTQKDRRNVLEKIVKKSSVISLTKKLVTSDISKLKKFYADSLAKGNEGLILKNLEKKYTPGRKVSGWVKIKPVLENLDLVITGAVYGEGKRANVFSSFILSCVDGNKFLECGMMGTGIKEKGEGVTFKFLTDLLKKDVVSGKGREVVLKPKVVVEVAYEEIQKSPTYSSGYALRFPRLVVFREDKGIKGINTLKDISRVFKEQKKLRRK